MKRWNKKCKMAAFAAVAGLAALSLAACGSKGGGGKEGSSSKDVPTLVWYQVGSGQPKNYADWEKQVNDYLVPKIGAKLDVQVISWGDWDNKRSVIVNTNQPFDIMFTNLTTYPADIRLGAFADLTDLLPKDAPDLVKLLPQQYWDGVKVDGKIYGVPTYKDSSVSLYFVWDKALAEKNGIDVNSVKDLKDLTGPLTKIKEATGKPSFILANGGFPQVTYDYDSIGAGLPALGVRFDDKSRKVVSVFEQPDVMANLKLLHQWFQAGIINADAATADSVPNYRPVFVAQGWSLAAQTVWGPQMGVEAVAKPWGPTIVSNDSVQGSMSCISANSKHKDKALQLLQLVNTDTKLRDMLYFGVQGQDFEYTADGRVKKLKNEWPMAGYTQGSFFDVSLLDTDKVDQWNEVKKLNEKATPSVMLGFSFDTTKVSDELANCNEIYKRYESELTTGAKDPEVEVPAMMKEMRAAGFDKIVQEAQSQIDKAFAK